MLSFHFLSNNNEEVDNMNRRELLLAAGGAAAAGAFGSLTPVESFAAEGHKHEHHTSSNNEAFINSSLECIKTAELCLSHCLDTLSTGDTSLASCAKSVSELSFICESTFKAASKNSKYLKDLVLVAAKVCAECEKECSKHKKHKTCLDCANACTACLKECKKLTG